MKKKAALLTLPLLAIGYFAFHAGATALPDPKQDVKAAGHTETVVLAGGCFWGVQAVFLHVKGVESAVSGYAGGGEKDAHYETVSAGTTGHAESVEVKYDPEKVSFGQLLKIYFSVAHDPTQLNHQGYDEGTQYRSEIFFTTPEQETAARAYIKQLDDAKAFPSAIVTKIEPLKGFYPAEDYHQNYAALHPENPYIVVNDLPKVAHLQRQFPDLYVEHDEQ